MTNPTGIHVGANTAISFQAAILTHDFINGAHKVTKIGANCFIGARSIILPGVNVGDNAIVGSGSVVFTDVPANSVVSGNPARVVERNIVTGRWGIRHPKFLHSEGIFVHPATNVRTETPEGVELLRSYFPGVRDYSRAFTDLGIDSFTLITLRAEIEQHEGAEISDEDWTNASCPADVARFISKEKADVTPPVVAATAKRQQVINMPQMAMGGLSEAWLFKEVGDIHWSILTSSLGVNSRDIQDQGGSRLYATFTRIRLRTDVPLYEFRENDELIFEAATSRFGAGMFFSSIKAKSSVGTIEFELMSSFAKFGADGTNTSLVRGQPTIPDNFPIPSLNILPEFAEEYRQRRSDAPAASIFTTDYTIIPVHDINGVGLLYFASYPTINEICISRYLPDGNWTPVERDCCYFANSGPDETIRFDIVSLVENDDDLHIVSTLTRADGKQMARISTRLRRRLQDSVQSTGDAT